MRNIRGCGHEIQIVVANNATHLGWLPSAMGSGDVRRQYPDLLRCLAIEPIILCLKPKQQVAVYVRSAVYIRMVLMHDGLCGDADTVYIPFDSIRLSDLAVGSFVRMMMNLSFLRMVWIEMIRTFVQTDRVLP